jgi:hypothetical protein
MPLQALLDRHNALRAKHKAPPLSWGPDLATGAALWARRCIWGEDTSNKLGENIYAVTNAPFNMTEAVDLWYQEVGGPQHP